MTHAPHTEQPLPDPRDYRRSTTGEFLAQLWAVAAIQWLAPHDREAVLKHFREQGE